MGNNAFNMLYVRTRWKIFQTLNSPLPSVTTNLHKQMQMLYKQTADFLLNNVKHLHNGTQMSLWLKIKSTPKQPIAEALSPAYAWLIHQTTSILLPLPLVNEHTHTHCMQAHAHTWVQCTQILTGLCMNTQTLPPPSWLIHQTELVSWVPEA